MSPLPGMHAGGSVQAAEVAVSRRTVLTTLPLADYPAWFEREVKSAHGCLLHNADLMPPDFDKPVAVSWLRSSKPLTVSARLVPRDRRYVVEQGLIWAMTELSNGDALQRRYVRPLIFEGPEVVWRNHEASLDLRSLEPASRRTSTYALQEYFVPTRHFLVFATEMARIIREHRAKVLNVSIRHSPPDEVSLLPWAREEVFSFVVYYKQRAHPQALEDAARWTRAMIDAALSCDGTYYLPYQLHATRAQFAAAYPHADAFRAVKRDVDPAGRLSNTLWQRYL